MAKVYVRDGEPIDRALKRFTNAVSKDGILRELKMREYFLTATQKKRIKKEEARKRFMKNLKKKFSKEDSLSKR